jgi:hypothetical protein
LLKFGGANGSPASSATPPSRVLVLNLDGHLYIRDLTGGAELRWNDQSVTEAGLRHGDRVGLGKVEYEVLATRCATPVPRRSIQAELRGGNSVQPVRTPVTLLARSAVADVRLGGEGGGDACALIVRVGDRYWLWNLEPTSEPRVNGRPAARAELTDGTTVAIAESEFRFHLGPAPAPPAPASAPTKAPSQAAKPAPVPASGASAKPRSVETPSATQTPAKPAGASTPKVGAPTSKPKSKPAAPPVPSEAALPARTNGGKTLHEDDAKSIKGWGPLALAVAAADRPELQGVSVQHERVQQPPATVEPTGARSRRRWLGVVLSLVVAVAGVAGAVFAWQHWKH